MKKLFLTFFLVFALATSCFGAIVREQVNSGYNGGPVTLGDNAKANSLLVVWVSGASAVTNTTLSGGGVTTWNPLTEYIDSYPQTYGRFYWGITTGGAVSITIGTAPSDPGWSIHEYSGMATSAFDQQNGAQTQYTPFSSGNITTTQADEVLVGALADEGADVYQSIDAGWALRTAETSHYHRTFDRIVSAIDTYACTGTFSDSHPSITVIASFKASVGGGTKYPFPDMIWHKRYE